MPLSPLRGHHEARKALARAVLTGSLPQSILLHGPAGVGKERLALWLGQLLVCGSPIGEDPCGSCLPCRLVGQLQHPDVHWFFPLPRPDAATPEKLREKLEEARAAELQARRDDPHHLPAYDRAPAHFLASIQNLQQLAAVRPTMGSRKVFVVGDAEAMVPQESSPEAANAFLKLLEEPPAETTLILTTAHPGSLLPTIRSRVLPVRLLPLDAEEVADFLRTERGVEPARAQQVASVSGGAIGRALRLLPVGDTPGPLEAVRQNALTLLLATLSDAPVPRLAAAHAQAPAGARGEFLPLLAALAEWLRDLLAIAAGVPDQVVNLDTRDQLVRHAEQRRLHPLGVTAALARIPDAQDLAYGNVNPQLILADLLRGIQTDLRTHA